MVEWDGEELPGPEDFADLDAFDELDAGMAAGSAQEARQAGATPWTSSTGHDPAGGRRASSRATRDGRAVSQALVARTHLVVQAGTGTGKSLAYLVPAALSGEQGRGGHRHQGPPGPVGRQGPAPGRGGARSRRRLDFAVLKGRSNYVCRQRVAEIGRAGPVRAGTPAPRPTRPTPTTAGPSVRRHGPGEPADRSPRASVEEVRRLVRWAGRHRHRRPGRAALRAALPGLGAWLASPPASARGPSAAPRARDCFAEAARARAAEADVVVVNTHLYGAHLASGGAVLPEHQVVVFDEAHEVEEVMTDSLGVEVGPGRFRALAAAARPLSTPSDGRPADLATASAAGSGEPASPVGPAGATRSGRTRGPSTSRRRTPDGPSAVTSRLACPAVSGRRPQTAPLTDAAGRGRSAGRSADRPSDRPAGGRCDERGPSGPGVTGPCWPPATWPPTWPGWPP